MLFGDKVIDCEILGIASSRTTRGHRFHSKGEFDVATPSTYATQLKQQGHVIASFAERQQMIVDQVSAEAHKFSGHAEIDPELLDEVTGLVEWPTALCGQFEDSFLEVPSEALISSMKEHQKYFHLLDSEGNLMPRFITVSNIISKNPAQVIDGNERVIRPRLADAKFFFETDKQTSLEARIEKLKSLVFQAKLGSVFDKTQRIKAIAGFIAKTLDLPSDQLSLIARAADLCKSDLVTNMVYEFTDLQGLAGYHYALNDGESESVALAMQEQYLPKFAGDAVPSSDVGALIAIADRLDTIVGIFGLGQKPTGSKDPFGLRRASLGVLRILVERDYDLDLKDLVAFAKDQFADLPKRDEVETNVLGYMLDRFKSWYSDEGISAETFMAVFAKNITVPKDFNTRIFAVSDFSNLPESASLASANKRVSNILAKFDGEIPSSVNTTLLSEPAEQALAEKVNALSTEVEPLFKTGNYSQSLSKLASLKTPVDSFFDDVMVMADDEAIKLNRLALLQQLRNLFLNVADISQLVTANA